MKIIQDRIALLQKEKSNILHEYIDEDEPMQMMMAMANIKLELEINFLIQLDETLTKNKFPNEDEIETESRMRATNNTGSFFNVHYKWFRKGAKWLKTKSGGDI